VGSGGDPVDKINGIPALCRNFPDSVGCALWACVQESLAPRRCFCWAGEKLTLAGGNLASEVVRARGPGIWHQRWGRARGRGIVSHVMWQRWGAKKKGGAGLVDASGTALPCGEAGGVGVFFFENPGLGALHRAEN
jgi:hypothetical protein